MNKIKWGVLGTAGIARNATIPGMLQAENCALTAIAGRNMEKALQFRELFGFEKAYDSYDALLSDPDIQAVYIPLPNELHCEWTIRALKAGKHVLCEKPLAPTAQLAEKMIACARENGVLLMEAFAYLHSPLTKAIKAALPKIGDVLYMDSAFITSDYHLSNIRMRRETFGGSLYDLGCYNISQILWMLEEEPETVQASAVFSDQKVDSITNGLLTFRSGAKATFTCGMVLATEKDRRIDRLLIHGVNGSIRCDARFNQDGELSYVLDLDGSTETIPVSTPHNYRLEVEQMGRCIAGTEQPHVSNDFSMVNSRTLDRVLRAIGY